MVGRRDQRHRNPLRHRVGGLHRQLVEQRDGAVNEAPAEDRRDVQRDYKGKVQIWPNRYESIHGRDRGTTLRLGGGGGGGEGEGRDR